VFGNEEKADVENIDAMKLTEKLEMPETSQLLDISGDVTDFEPTEERWGSPRKSARCE